MGKLKDWWNRPIKRSTFYFALGLFFLLIFGYMVFRANNHLRINELHCGVVNEDLCVVIDGGYMQRVLLHKIWGYVNSETPVCEGDTVTLVSFHGGLDDEFRCYLGQPNEELISLMMHNALVEVYRLFGFIGGGYVLMFIILSLIELSMERKDKN